ncbi:transcriptional regulator, TetR family [Seinonella peptonophila]|uniref:Transcriptional regulator, TetR family n=1 Tax=Seinonella peptonophila TaxID=112248 RepID=A0A1M4XWS4_9BACL|nr:TetR/AcrR family transcriptional regulator [Seinonella peptonophila]SHE97885.1 transcriptional regulator, TetR family [Seinonella peptonophila]
MNKRLIPSMVKNEQLVERRRQQIIDGAVQLFTKKGFHKTTTREIAQKCKMSIGTMYEYIQTKEDVLFLVCEAIHEKMESRLRRTIKGHDNGFTLLKHSFRQLLKIMDEMRPLVLLIYQETKSLPKEQMKYVLEKELAITSLFEDVLEKGIQDGSIQLETHSISLMAHNIMVMGQMWTFRYWSLGRTYSLDEYIEQQLALLIRELKA